MSGSKWTLFRSQGVNESFFRIFAYYAIDQKAQIFNLKEGYSELYFYVKILDAYTINQG